MTTDANDLRDCVDELYQVFAPYRRTPMDVYCSCCVDEGEYERLVEPELEEVGHDAINHYVYNAICTWGDVNGFKRFLPRIYEALAFERHECFWISSMWSSITKLAYADWEDWPDREREAIDRYLKLLWLHVLAGEPAHPDSGIADDADAVLDGLATVYSDVRPFLDVWREKVPERLGAAERLAQFVRFSGDFFEYGKPLGIEGWTAGADAQVQEWLRDSLLVEGLGFWLDDCDDEVICWSLDGAIELLKAYQKRP